MPRPANRPANSVSFFTSLFLYFIASFSLGTCSSHSHPDPFSLTLIIESNPANLDPRFATDAQSQHIDGLLFSSLLERDNQMNFRGDLAESWNTPDPLTYVFHLRRGIRFHDGRPLTAADVKATFDFILDPANHSPKRGGFRMVTSIEAPDDATVIFHLKEPYASFTVNLIRPAVGIVPANAAAALQEQWRRVGIDLGLRPLELATLLSDAVKGNFQLNLLRWVGANTDPDIFEFVYSTKRFPPDGANRGHYRNARIDALTDQIHVEMDPEKRKALCSEVQKILAEELPYLPLWFSDVVSIHRRFTPSGSPEGSGGFNLSPTGDFDFLATLALTH